MEILIPSPSTVGAEDGDRSGFLGMFFLNSIFCVLWLRAEYGTMWRLLLN